MDFKIKKSGALEFLFDEHGCTVTLKREALEYAIAFHDRQYTPYIIGLDSLVS